MVQLNTTYDKDLKQRVFVLKGEETYARTTDVLASLVSDYTDCSTRLNYARVGIEIEVLRNFGDGFIYIYDNDVCLHSYDLPWFDEVSEMESYYDPEIWGDKGVVYSDGKLLIGTDSILTSGFNLAYDVEHNIKVVYSGGYKSGTDQKEKYCLGSSSELLTFEMPVPELYESTLTMESGSDNVYIKRSEVTDITIEYTSKGEMSNTKTVQLYNNGVLIDDDLELTKGVSSTITFSSGTLDIGLNSLRAVFIGDDESTYAETSLDISIGCQIEVTDYPTVLLNGTTGSAKCTITDYFNNPITTGKVKARRYDATDISSEVSLDSDGKATISPISISSSKWKIAYVYDGSIPYSSEWITTNIASVTDITMNTSDAYIGDLESMNITGTVTSNVSAEGLLVQYTYNESTNSVRVNSNNAFTVTIQGDSELGDKQLTVSCGGISKTKPIHNVYAYWNKGVKEVNFNYSVLDGGLYAVSNGYLLTAILSKTGQLRLTPPAYVSMYNYQNYELSFNVDNSDGSTFGFGQLSLGGTYYETEKSVSVPPTNSNVKIRVDWEINIYVNEELVWSGLNEVFEPTMPVILVSGNYPARFRINNLVWKKIEGE